MFEKVILCPNCNAGMFSTTKARNVAHSLAKGQLLLELLFDPAKIQQRMDAEYNHQVRMRAMFSRRASSSEMMFRAMLKRRK